MSCADGVGLDALLLYWLDEMPAAERDSIEEHLFECYACTRALAEAVELGDAIRVYVGQGWVSAALTPAFVERLAADGVRLREYRVEPNSSVECTVAPRDQLVLSRLVVPLAGVEKLDLLWLDESGREEQRLRDVPFAAAASEVIFAPQIDRLRALSATTVILRAVAVQPGPERILGDYTFIHSPWNDAAE